uniref:Uncharacterized protein n=1 Tax=Arundo donax TaxID=35708 RepID=A0A0A9F076_ARUDO
MFYLENEAASDGESRRYKFNSSKLAKLCHSLLRTHINNRMLNLIADNWDSIF